jgi:shikimate kinase
MGSGKTSVGRELAELLGWQFRDLDAGIEAQERRSVSEIFKTDGEAHFRELERQALSRILLDTSSALIVALGGGTFAQPDNLQLFADPATVTVFLDAPVEELWNRCKGQPNTRPLQQNREHFRNLYEDRRQFYTRAGLHIQTSGKSVDVVAQEIAERLRSDYEVKEKS